ncbi:histidine kinase dimerization/phosphoacceptor domain-containing protein [Streptomyces niveus]|uniref:histidine kinase dimerization/phosphoacceptor domain-containing protein n=1 Tax=Streptomyces niveus TaxID=193462 RepID=UPI0034504FE5
MTFERVRPRVRAVPPITADLPVAAGVALFTASDAAVNDPEHRQADAFTWLLVAVSVLALAARRRSPVPVVVVTGAACAGWALYGHIGELLNLPVIVALYTVAVPGDRRRTVWTVAVAARRVHEERVRIARELHDIVAHTVTAMTVWAGVALDTRPEISRKAMRQVRDSGREAVRELRATVTVLRGR